VCVMRMWMSSAAQAAAMTDNVDKCTHAGLRRGTLIVFAA